MCALKHEELVSIIIPVYNVEQYLTACLDSVIGQTYQNPVSTPRAISGLK